MNEQDVCLSQPIRANGCVTIAITIHAKGSVVSVVSGMHVLLECQNGLGSCPLFLWFAWMSGS